jgi:hypothetical protein
MALHEQSVGASDEWYTPLEVFAAMHTRFDLDVSGALFYCPADECCERAIRCDSLSREWNGFVWMNPPFGGRNGIVPWLDKFVRHGNGVALVPDRTSAPWWQDYAPAAELLLMVRQKIKFISGTGHDNRSPAQGTTLLAIGEKGQQALLNAARVGFGTLLVPYDHARPR